MIYRPTYPKLLPFLISAVLLPAAAFIPKAHAATTCAGADQPAARTADPGWRKSVVCLINQERARYRRPALKSVGTLSRGAQKYSQTMVEKHVFSHSNLESRFKHSGYLRGMELWGMGENILWSGLDSTTPREAVRLWLASPHHRSNLLSSAWKDTGVGIAQGNPNGSYGWTAVQWFGSRSR